MLFLTEDMISIVLGSCRARTVGQYPHLCADRKMRQSRCRAATTCNDAMLLVRLDDDQIGIWSPIQIAYQSITLIASLLGSTSIARQRHPTCIHEDPAAIRPAADHGREYRKRDDCVARRQHRRRTQAVGRLAEDPVVGEVPATADENALAGKAIVLLPSVKPYTRSVTRRPGGPLGRSLRPRRTALPASCWRRAARRPPFGTIRRRPAAAPSSIRLAGSM
jgi:hypothetical protein